MTDINDKCLEMFPTWLESLGNDVQAILALLMTDELDPQARRFLTGGINYLFKSLDLIPDGIDDIGYLDDAFVLRLAAKAATEGEIGAVSEESLAAIRKLAEDAELIAEFLEENVFGRLDKYTRRLVNGAARGRLVDEIVEKPDVFKDFAMEVDTFITEFTAPGFSKDEKNLVKLKAFFDAKLPK